MFGKLFTLKGDFNGHPFRGNQWSKLGAGPAESFSSEINKPKYTPEEMVSKAFNGNKDLIDEFHAANARIKKAVEAGGESYRQHALNLEDLDSGKSRRVRYSADRLKSHRQIIDSILDGSSKYKAKEGESPEVLFLGGRGGSGKGNFHKSKGYDSGLYDSKSHLLLDPDEVKKRMKEYDPEMAYLTHKESADIFDKLVSVARRRKLNVVLDTTMRSPLNHVVSRFEKHGYSMQAHFMHMPPEGAALRALQRWSKGEDTPSGTKTKRGRLVPPDVIYAMKNNEKNFDSILPKMKKWSVWSNDQPLGVPPVQVASSEDKKVKKSLARVLVEKANPYHDSKGRFTSRANAGFVSLWGKNSANIDADSNKGANAKASSFHKQKVKEFSHILGVHVRGGGTTNDAFGKAALGMAQLHAEGAKAYGTHSVSNIGQGSRDKIHEDVAQAFAASNLTTGQKVKAGIPLTEAEKKAIEKSKEYDKKHYSKKQLAKALSDLETHAETVKKLQNDPNYESNPDYQKASKALSKATTMATKHGGSSSEVSGAILAGINKVGASKEAAHKELHTALMEMHHANSKGVDAALHASVVGDLLVKHEKTLSKEEMAAAGAKASAEFKDKKTADQAKLADAYSAYQPFKKDPAAGSSWASLSKQHGIPVDHMKKLYEDYQAAYKQVEETYGKNAAGEAIQKGKEIHAAKKAAGITPFHDAVQLTATAPKPSLSEVLQAPTKPEVAAPAKTSDAPKVASPSSFKEPQTKAEAMDAAKAMGKQFYLLQQGKYPNAPKDNPPKELADAHALYEKAKDAYVKLGGNKSEFSDISSKLKHSVQAELQAEKDKAKQASTNAYNALAKASHDLAQAKSDFGASSVEAKAAEKTLNAAKKAAKGVVNDHMVEPAIQEGIQTHKANKAAKKAAALQEVHEASYELNAALLKHKNDPNHEEVLKAASSYDAVVSKHSESKMFSASELAATTAEAKAKAKANAKAQAEFAKKYGSASKVVASYDKESASFEYPNHDPDFTAHGVAQVKKLTSEEKAVVSSYTGSAFTALNKAVGKAGTAKMQGAAAEHISSYQKSQMKAMDAAFAKTTLGKNVKLRRNMPQKYFWEQLGIGLEKVSTMTQADLDKMVGKVYKETAFSSTSMRSNFSSSFAKETSNTGGAILRIRAGASMPGLRAKSISNHEGEDEVILPRGTTYVIRKIVPVNSDNFKFEVHVDMIGAFPDPL